MASKKQNSIDLAERMAVILGQFKNLDNKDPSLWPTVPKIFLYLAVMAAVAVASWFIFLKDYETELEEARSKETALRDGYRQKLVKAVNLDVLKKQREQIQQYVIQLEKQLPSKAEMAALLSDINQAGLGRSLQFELFKPGQVVAKNYYAELPIAIRVSGKYHDIGAFAADIAHLSRIVTLNNIAIAPTGARGANMLTLDATARTFRYLDPEEVQAQKKAGGAK
ncbi:type IV pilus inner membrane component PilO [Verminephrobacter eiseniae]|uniref:Pilus assembly protein, PilO n=1 Tax=Verminephrobacter eiseniae (strain EF01-2) TaxID=391735 RepID=A1WDV6_VEREI|nr:type 4a pilus biogenesis protein PilO [Verminephrobacter eiseniae]ABM55813.1 Pilus assembly protein, PilO [Verminephrobacter eiseniae EF01-2]MCW5261026.1 pilus assembly protein PilO [Verminephrobacter eiseniae]MCW5286193.1 pilus assembly protein PilO [Verminephrobacter eiseniae]MCW5304492.1 pilus assembly protein PilO [Verminephrobacter eiseniae]MCW8181632.1 pilus assembly protein PilO [Verminephrobacter eiseniae]